MASGGEDLRYEHALDGFVDDLGPYSVALKSPCMTVGGMLSFALHLPCVPADVRLHTVSLHLRQKFELSSPTDPAVTAHAPFQTLGLVSLSHDTPRAPPSARPVVQPGVLVTANARPHTTQAQGDQQKLLALVPAGAPLQMACVVRLPRDDELRPSTGDAARGRPIRTTHELRVEIRYWTPGSKERVVRLAAPVSFASCCCLVESMNLPDYSTTAASATPKDAQALLSMVQTCACEMSTEALLALHRKDLVDARPLAGSSAGVQSMTNKATYEPVAA